MPKVYMDFDVFANKALKEIGNTLVGQAQKNMDTQSYGRVYRIGGKLHIASKPKDTANNMTGALRKTIRYELSGKVLEFGAGNSKINYAKYLEKGTQNMAERPNYTKSLYQSKAKIDGVIKKLLKDSIRVV